LRQEKDLSFLILLGDCAGDPSRADHDYFRAELSGTGLTIPTFIVAGNHDVQTGVFGLEEFEALYGPADFSVVYRDCLAAAVVAGPLASPRRSPRGIVRVALARAAESRVTRPLLLAGGHIPYSAYFYAGSRLLSHAKESVETTLLRGMTGEGPVLCILSTKHLAAVSPGLRRNLRVLDTIEPWALVLLDGVKHSP
jgi:hypothetical protein